MDLDVDASINEIDLLNSDIESHHKRGFIGCFIVENDSYLEIRDCFVRSIKDPKVIEKEKELFI